MATDILDDLLKLPAAARAELALALWDSLADSDREATIELTDDQAAELDRRWTAYQANPDAAISLDEMKRRLSGASTKFMRHSEDVRRQSDGGACGVDGGPR